MIDPIHQFNIDKIFTIGHIGNQEIAFTNSSAYMFISVALISLLMIGGSAGGSSSRAVSSRWPNSATNSWPTPSEAAPARKA